MGFLTTKFFFSELEELKIWDLLIVFIGVITRRSHRWFAVLFSPIYWALFPTYYRRKSRYAISNFQPSFEQTIMKTHTLVLTVEHRSQSVFRVRSQRKALSLWTRFEYSLIVWFQRAGNRSYNSRNLIIWLADHFIMNKSNEIIINSTESQLNIFSFRALFLSNYYQTTTCYYTTSLLASYLQASLVHPRE